MEFAFDGTHTTAEWQKWHGRNVEVDEGTVRLERERTPTYVSPRLVVPDSPESFIPVDIDVDECGDLYVLTAEGEVHRYDHRSETLRKLPCLWYPEEGTGGTDEGPTVDPVGICVTEDSIYVADGALRGVVAFSKRRYQTRWIARSVGNEPFADPVACIGDDRTGYLLDRGSSEGGGFVARLDVGGVAEAPVVSGLQVPADLAMGSDGDLYVLDRQVRDPDEGGNGTGDPVPVVRRFSATNSDEGEDGEEDAEEFVELAGDKVWIPPEYVPTCIEAVTERQILMGVGTGPPGMERETTPYRYLPPSEPGETGRFERLTSFQRTAAALLLRRRGTSSLGRGLYVISGPEGGPGGDGDGELYFLEEVTRNLLNAETGGYDAQIWKRLDSGVPGTKWHRVLTDLHLGETGTQVRLNYRATDDRDVGDLEDDLGIDSKYSDRLREARITGAWGVLEHDPEVLADLASVPQSVTAVWVEAAWRIVDETATQDVETIRGIGATYRNRFDEAGVTSVADLLGLEVDEIVEIANPQRGQRDARVWLRRARDALDDGIDDWIDTLNDQIGTLNGQIDAVDREPVSLAQLQDIGVDRLSDLTIRSPEWLARRLRVSPGETEPWLEQARTHVEQEWSRGEPPSSITDPLDALLEDAVGQYLRVGLSLVGSDSSSPGVDSFRAYFPRQSYLRYLPAVYRKDERSAAFLERFLSVFESEFVGIEEDIGSVTKYLDAEGVPEEYLSWLGGWLGIETDETWPEDLKRKVVRRAPDLFKMRGTPEGLMEMLVAYLGDSATLPPDWVAALERDRERSVERGDRSEPAEEVTEEVTPRRRAAYLIEYSDLDCIDVDAAREAYVGQLGCPQCFLVLVAPFAGDDAVGAVERIVDSATPAHAVGRTVGLRPRIRLGGASFPGDTYLGVNSALSDRRFSIDESTLGADSVLIGREAFSELELRSRLDTDTVIS